MHYIIASLTHSLLFVVYIGCCGNVDIFICGKRKQVTIYKNIYVSTATNVHYKQ
jgi:hypothetical protein